MAEDWLTGTVTRASIAAVHLDLHETRIHNVHNARYRDACLCNVGCNNDLPHVCARALEHRHLSLVRHRGVDGNGGEGEARAAAGGSVVQQADDAFDVVLRHRENAGALAQRERAHTPVPS